MRRQRQKIEQQRAKTAADTVVAAEQAEAKRLAEDEAQQVRLAAIVRDGNTLYEHGTFKHLSKRSFTPFDDRDIRVYYPDGSSCDVATPSRGRSAARPFRLVMPWTRRRGVVPPTPCEWATLNDLEHIAIALIAMSSGVFMSCCTGWREKHLERAVCCANDCVYGNDCVTYEPSRVPTPSELKRLGIDWGGHIGFAPAHIGLGEFGKWDGPPPPHIQAAVASAALPDGPRPRTMFTHRAASEGLPGSLQYMQEGDVVLWNQVPHFVYKIGAVTYQDESEILFRTPQQQGRNCGLANRDGYTAFLSDVARELEPPRAEDIAWAHAVAAAVKDGTPEEALPPPPPLPPVWRNPSA